MNGDLLDLLKRLTSLQSEIERRLRFVERLEIPVLPVGIYNENHSSECDGVNVTFNTVGAIISSSSRVFLNGVRQKLGTDYLEGASSITFSSAPLAGDLLMIDYGSGDSGVFAGGILAHQFVFAYQDDAVVSSGRMRIYNVFGATGTIKKVFLAAHTAPTGAALIVDININGVTIFTNQAHRPQIAAGSNIGFSISIDVPGFTDGDYLTMDIDQIGSSSPGAFLTAHVVVEV